MEGRLRKAVTVPDAVGRDEPGFKFSLTDHELDQIAIAYFHELAEEFEDADAIATGDETKSRRNPEQDITTAFHLVTLIQLIKYHFLDE